MKKILLVIFSVLLMFSTTTTRAQDKEALLKAHLRNFEMAGIEVKIQILEDAAASGIKELGPLYLQALDYVLSNTALITADGRLRQMVVVAAGQIKESGYAEARYSLWELFKADQDNLLRVGTLNGLSVVGKGDPAIIQEMNRWLEAQNTFFISGKKPDFQVLNACIAALAEIGDSTSFPAIFSAANIGYPVDTVALSKNALQEIEGDLDQNLKGIIRDQPIADKKVALVMALEHEGLEDDRKAEVAEFAMDMALHMGLTDAGQRAISREIRFEAAKALMERKWSRATPLAIEHFDATLLEYERGVSTKNSFLEAIATLGSMGSHDAAVRLTQYLVLMNSYSENGKSTDDQIILAVVNNLGGLGDKVAFDDLKYVGYLNYNSQIKKAARKSLENLKW
ncbi:MAG: hypothetical protein GH155_05680 [Spirochaeta sp.]|nr:hypothetical protein [Spirochaeta sp.]